MTNLEDAQKEYREATDEWSRLSSEYGEAESQLATAEYENSDEVDISALQETVRERKNLADEAMNRQIRALNMLTVFDQ